MSLSIEELENKSKHIRLQMFKMLGHSGTGHPGGSLSATDILVALYYNEMHLYSDPKDDRRDRFVLSKGHANPPLYAILSDLGYFPEDTLWTLRQLGSKLQGHPDMNKAPGIDCSTGSLGQGISIATGMAIGLKMRGSDSRVYALLGDGELQEGMVWESFMSAANYKLDNLTVIIDRNHLQIDGNTENVMALGNLSAKLNAFGFEVIEINGHDFNDILPAIHTRPEGKPLCIIADTVKGKGVSFLENQVSSHGNVPKGELFNKAISELEA